jgi:hypothetical protein
VHNRFLFRIYSSCVFSSFNGVEREQAIANSHNYGNEDTLFDNKAVLEDRDNSVKIDLTEIGVKM